MTSFFEVQGRKIPRVFLGTSPFLGAGQFGTRAARYHETFYQNPDNMVVLMAQSWRIGVKGIQAVAYPRIIEAIEKAKTQEGIEPVIVGTILPGELDSGIDLLGRVNAVVGLLHGSETDRCSGVGIAKSLEKIRSAGMVPGLAIHRALPTLRFLIESGCDYEILMIPLNPKGIMVANLPETLEAVKKVKCPIIAKKALGAGRIPPSEALPWVAELGVAGVALGVASEEEAKETFTLALELFR